MRGSLVFGHIIPTGCKLIRWMSLARCPLLLTQIPSGFRDVVNISYFFATERLRSINLGSFGSKPDLGSLGVNVAQFGSSENTRRNNGSDSSTRPMLTSAIACQ